MGELDLDRTLRKGDRGKKVRAVQEWVSLRGVGLVTDAQFGPATQFGVKAFQSEHGLTTSGIVGQSTFAEMIAPMRRAIADRPPGPTLGNTVAGYAKQHLDQGPREVGGQNTGPWVRLYMAGNEGEPWPWCAGFASFVLNATWSSHGIRWESSRWLDRHRRGSGLF